MHWSFTDANQTVTVNLAENSSTGKVWGTVQVGILTYPVNGYWEASNGGGIAARKESTLHLGGFVDLAGGAANFVALSGHISGLAPNMTGIDLKVHVASGGTASLSQDSAELTTIVTADPPPETDPPSGGTPGTAWQFSSLDGKAMMDVLVGSAGVINGNLTIDGDTYVGRGWMRGVAFDLLGTHEASPGADDLLGAVGIVSGPWQQPNQVQISGSAASISNKQNNAFEHTLLPMYRQDADLLNTAYAESYVVIQIPHGDGQLQGWIGPTGADGKVAPFGSADYRTAGTAMTADQLADIVKPDPEHPGINDIRVPAFQSADGIRPVMVQFIGEAGHFPQPPLEEAHPQIDALYYDDAAGALVLQFSDQPAGAKTSVINFNSGRKKNHNSVIIEPR
ncbi:hypothetical protein [Halomonas denitrificans]|nr:hypothetical protein [Halomonas denitrificans]